MTKADLVAKVVKRERGVTTKDVNRIIDSVFQSIIDELSDGGKCAFTGFGNFSVVKREARTGRNPATGQAIEIEAKSVPRFKPSANFIAKVNDE